MKYWLLGAMAALALTVSVPASAQVPRTMSYQGTLTDNLGNPVADGNYSLTVRLYDAANGGAAVFTENFPAVVVAKGGFNVLIGSVTPLTLAFDKPRWLSLQVGANPELSPRVALASSPYSMGLSLPFDGTANGATPTFVLRNSGGPALRAEGSTQVYAPGGTTPVAETQSYFSQGGQTTLKDEFGANFARIEPDLNGTGGYVVINRDAASAGFTINGNDGSGQPVVTIQGTSRSAVFDMGSSSDASVLLPTGAVNALESFNEAGVAHTHANSSIQIGLGVTAIVSRTITAPDDGYVIVVAGGSFEMDHVVNTDSRIIYGVNDVNNAFASSTGVAGVPSTAPSGNYRFPTPWTGVWPVTAGAKTFYLLAQRIGAANGAVLNDPTITLIYVPTAYGTVTGNRAFGEGSAQGVGAPLTPADMDAEQSEAKAFDQARIQHELDIMRARIESIQGRISGNEPSAAATAAPQK